MSRPRMANETTRSGPKTLVEWDRLMKKAIHQARTIQDLRRLRAMEKALQEGKSAQCLKRMSIICEADIQRELSLPKT